MDPERKTGLTERAGPLQLNNIRKADVAGLYVKMDYTTGQDENGLDNVFIIGLGDMDLDHDVDLDEWATFADCMDGPHATPTPALPGVTIDDCLTFFDFDIDSDVDTEDFAGFQVAFTGSMS